MIPPKLLPAPTKKRSLFHLSLLPREAQALWGRLPLLALPNQKLLWIGLAVFFSLNVLLLANSQPPLWSALIPVYARPFTAAPHRVLAREYANNALPDGAVREGAIVADLVDAPVLGVSTSQRQSAVLTTHIEYWKNVVATKPGYRDGWLALSQLLYQQGNRQDALAAAEKAAAIDPGSTVAHHLVELLTNEQVDK